MSDASLSDDDHHFDNPFAAAAGLSAEDELRGRKCEVMSYEARHNWYGEPVMLRVGQQSKLRPAEDRDYHAAMIKVKKFNRDMEIIGTELRIQSPFLKTAMRQVIKSYPGINFSAGRIIIRDQPRCFFHYRDELVQYGMTLRDEEAIKHLSFILDYTYKALQTETLNWYMWAENPMCLPGLEYDYLWMAFRPGCLVYKRVDDTDTVMRLEKMIMPEVQFTNVETEWRLTMTQVIHDGKAFGRREVDHDMERYRGYKPFSELDVYPLEYHPEQQRIYDEAVVRGKKVSTLVGTHYRHYLGKGLLLSFQRDQTYYGEMDYFPTRKTAMNGRIVIDGETFSNVHPNQSFNLASKYQQYRSQEAAFAGFDNDDYATCHFNVPGFSLRDKSWGLFNVDRISDIEFSDVAFDKLMLPQGQKEMILSLVESHRNERSGFDDIIRGKGKGIIFLLHGLAGVGKTVTAESIAEKVGQPLYVVGAGDLGIGMNSIEKKLQEISRLATSWNAIVLIDEADVFLEERSTNDLKRNALVSVFLRVLEYYEGIMFLTTNRVKRFDKAFASRIHMAIQYDQLDTFARRELWQTFIARAMSNDFSPWLTDVYLDHLADMDLNGRQIKNVVRMAYALSVGDDAEMGQHHVATALTNMRGFEWVMGMEDSDSSDRDDVARSGPPRKRFRGNS